jgi:hypothetical protein
MGKSVLAFVRKCPVCLTSYIPEAGEICECPSDDAGDENLQTAAMRAFADDFPTERDRQEDA